MQRNIFSGSEFLLYNIDNVPVAYSTNCVLKINNNLSDVTTKDSDSFNEFMVGLKDWSIEFDGLVSYGDGFNNSFLLSKYRSGDPFFIKFGVVQENFENAFSGEVHIQNIEQSADNGEIVTYSGSLKGIGNLSFNVEGTPIQNGYLKVETDPVFRGSAAFNITEQDKQKWNEANNKIVQEIEFIREGEITTLKMKFQNGNIYTSSFQNTGGSGSINNLSFSKDNGILTVGNLTTNLDGRYQMAGTGVGTTYLQDKYYDKIQSDQKYYSIQNLNNFITGETETLDKILSRGNTSNRDITIGIITATGGNSTSWNTAFTNNHTHSNKSFLDSIIANATLQLNITGNATNWCNQTYLASPFSTAGTFVMSFDGTQWRPTTTAGVKSFLNIGDRSNWNDVGAKNNVVGQLTWNNYGNGHTVFDASSQFSPDGLSLNRDNAQYPWESSYPTLMGWNGQSTYGVRVDSSRITDSIRTSSPAVKKAGDIWIA